MLDLRDELQRSQKIGSTRAILGSVVTALLATFVCSSSVQGEDVVDVDCLIEPWRTISLAAAIEGVVEEVLVDRGDPVAEGQVVARLESSVERATVEAVRVRATAQGPIKSSEARLDLARRSLDRQIKLKEQDVVSPSDMDEARSTKQVAEAELLRSREERDAARLELARAEAVLERRTIRSPVAAVVVERILAPGEYADPPQVLEIAQIDPLRVEVFAPLALFGHIEVGDEVEIRPEAPVGGVHQATVTVVDPVIDAASGTFGVRLELPNADRALPAGLSCQARFPGAGAAAGHPEAPEPLAAQPVE